MHSEDFQTWREVPDTRTKCLFDYQTGEPTQEVLDSADGPLALIASMLSKSDRRLSAEDCEQVIKWLKLLKRERQSPNAQVDRSSSQFEELLHKFLDSAEQWKLLKQLRRHRGVHNLWLISAFLLLCVAISIAFAGVGWYWCAATVIVAFVMYSCAVGRSVSIDQIAKEQHTRYLLQSIRAAKSITELSRAGLFAYLPSTEVPFDADAIALAIRAERERLTDALHHDPDWMLRE